LSGVGIVGIMDVFILSKALNKYRCRLCQNYDTHELFNFGHQPISHAYAVAHEEEETYFPLVLMYCECCNLVQVREPIDPALLYKNYTFLTSKKHQPHVDDLFEWLKELELPLNTKFVEVGSNDGIFLEALRTKGFSNLLGIEPAKDAAAAANARGLKTKNIFFTESTAKSVVEEYGVFDVFIARQMLEHIPDLLDFIKGMKIILKDGGYAMFEVPDFDFALEKFDYSAFWEEHVNHFTPFSLEYFLRAAGLQVLEKRTYAFSGQALVMIAQKQQGENIVKFKKSHPVDFMQRWPSFKDKMKEALSDWREKGYKVWIYGAGNRVNQLINFCKLAPYLNGVYDDDSEKIGRYMPGSRLLIVSGLRLQREECDICLLAVNAENETKVLSNHPEFVQAGGIVYSLSPPSEKLIPFWKDFVSV
jgi:2-polyprenyl-3-methyl-5-hydroxy-6-metoxy-1,4-benzoquinol methylase